jgi:hypothetical protein
VFPGRHMAWCQSGIDVNQRSGITRLFFDAICYPNVVIVSDPTTVLYHKKVFLKLMEVMNLRALARLDLCNCLWCTLGRAF